MTNENTHFKGEIKVASRIVDYLSSGLYPSPAACLKELINNAYDADAHNVRVSVKPDADRIVIEDDGHGMNKEEFIRHFSRISESHKRDTSEVTSTQRPKIGKIGIGFIAANEICEVMEIFSTKAGSADLLHVTINFSEMSRPLALRTRGENDIAKADYEGEILETEEAEHYTHIFLERIRGEARDILVGAQSQSDKLAKSLYGKKADSVAAALGADVNSWKDFDYYSEQMLHVALNVPVAYADNWMPPAAKRKVAKFVDDVKALNFNVTYDGTELRKPTIFSPKEKKFFVETINFEGKNVSAKGYVYAVHGTVKPQELHGLLVRIRNSAVGAYDPTFWGFTPSIAPLIQRWVSVEIWADDRLEEAMNIDRSTLREAHPAYVELREFIHTKVRAVFAQAKSELYDAGSEIRKTAQATNVQQQIRTVLSAADNGMSKRAASAIQRTWNETPETGAKQRAILRKYSVSEFYELIIESANGLLDADQLEELLKRLTKRLSE